MGFGVWGLEGVEGLMASGSLRAQGLTISGSSVGSRELLLGVTGLGVRVLYGLRV